jgi:hypothetical protein
MKILRIAAAALVYAATEATLPRAVYAQTTGTAQAQGTAVRVYLNCSGFYCDRDFFRRRSRSSPTCATAATPRCTC